MSEKVNILAAKLLSGGATNKPTSDASASAGPSFKDKAPALIDRYKVSWETVVCDLTPRIQCLLANDPDLADQLLSWESETKATMQDVINAHINKYCN